MLAIGISQDINAYNRVENRLRHLIKVLDIDIDPFMGRFTEDEATRLYEKPYPPASYDEDSEDTAESVSIGTAASWGWYIRTNTLAESWEAKKGGRKGAWKIINDATDQVRRNGRLYANFVVGEQTAVMRRLGWWTVEEEMDGIKERLVNALEDEIARALNTP